MNEKFLKLLKNLDLSNYQIKIYFSVLKNGMSTVLDISKDTKMNRSQIYLDAPILVEKGLLEVGSKRNRRYLAVNPRRLEKLVEEKEQKLKELKSVLGEVGEYFEKREKRDENEFEIKIYEGLSQVKKAFEFELDNSKNSEIYSVVGAIDYQYDYLSEEFWHKWNKKFAENGGKGRMLINKQDKSYAKLKGYRQEYSIVTKGLENFSLKTNFDIWKDYVLIATFSKVPKAVIIKNNLLAESYKDIFEKLWKSAE